MPKAVTYVVPFLALIFSAGCSSEPADELPAAYIRVTIDKSEPERLLRYYFGGYTRADPVDPFEVGIVEDRGGRLYLNIDSLEDHFPGASAELHDANQSDRIEWEELERFIDATYYRARSAPPTLGLLYSDVSFESTSSDWMRVDVHGVMTTARRLIYIRESAVRDALGRYWENERQIIYPVGTTIFGQHWIGGRLAETTVMQKREDGFWDFFVYGENDSLAAKTTTPPKELKSPVQCVGCHFGDKLFEPEKSFPVRARPGPHGPRQLYVPDSLRHAQVVKFFDEHRKRSDTVLGLYTTLFVARLQSERRAGKLSEEDAALLDRLEL